MTCLLQCPYLVFFGLMSWLTTCRWWPGTASCSFTRRHLVFSSYWPAPSTCPALLLRAPHRVPCSCLHRRTVGTDIFSDVESRAFNVTSLSQSHTGTLRAPGAVTDYSFHRVKLSPRRKAVPELCCLALHAS